MVKRETRDGRRYGDSFGSEEMKAVMQRFSKAHPMSIHLNLITIIATHGMDLFWRLSCHFGVHKLRENRAVPSS